MASTDKTEEKLYTLQEVADRLRMSERTLHRKLDNSEISGQFFARRWHFTENGVQAYIRRSSRKDTKGIRKKRQYTRRVKETKSDDTNNNK